MKNDRRDMAPQDDKSNESYDEKDDATNAAGFHTQADNVFGRIAARYDWLCDLFSLGIHRLWKRKMAATMAAEPWSDLLDAAAGTGDVVLQMARHHGLKAHQRVVSSDISPEMLAIARQRSHSHSQSNNYNHKAQLQFIELNAESMPSIADASVDLFSISLGLKICDRHKVLQEALRVLRPGGRLVSLESSHIPWSWVNRLYLAYMALCMPAIGWIATGGDGSAYRYLLKGIRAFPTAPALAEEMEQLGFEEVAYQHLSLGIVAIHSARKPLAPLRQPPVAIPPAGLSADVAPRSLSDLERRKRKLAPARTVFAGFAAP